MAYSMRLFYKKHIEGCGIHHHYVIHTTLKRLLKLILLIILFCEKTRP